MFRSATLRSPAFADRSRPSFAPDDRAERTPVTAPNARRMTLASARRPGGGAGSRAIRYARPPYFSRNGNGGNVQHRRSVY